MGGPPLIEFKNADPLQDYYSDGMGGFWSVAKLIDDAKHLPIFDCPIACVDISQAVWDGESILGLAFHCKRVMDADTNEPILLDWHGRVADGRHRIMKAIIDGKATIKARRMSWQPDPCRKE